MNAEELDDLNADQLRKLLGRGIGTYKYEEGVAIRARLHFIGRMNYNRQHLPKDYLEFLARNECKFDRLHAQDQRPHVWCLFTVVSQHVYGDTVEEVLDKAMEIEFQRQQKN